MSEFIIETKNLSKRFYAAKNLRQFIFNPFARINSVLAIDNLSLQIKRAELFAVVGPNGAGKTTLIKILSGLVLPTKGNATVNAYDIIKDEVKVKESIGLLTGEERSFYWRLTGRENLNFFASLYNLNRSQAKSRIKELTRLLGIQNLDKRFQEYSTGMKQRFAVARSLLNNPAILFMDEPTKNLDPLAAKHLREFIKEELVGRQAKTVLFCTHNLSEAAFLAQRMAIIDKGRIKASDSLDGLREKANLPSSSDVEDIFRYYVAE